MDQRLWQVLSSTNEWVRYSDGKAVALLGIQGVLIGLAIVFLKDLLTSDSSIISKIFLFAGMVSIALSLLFTFLCLIPRLKSAGEIKISPIYFGSIATHFQDSNAYSKFLKENFNTEDKITDALAEQVYINAGIANIKFKWVSWSTKLLVTGLTFWAVFIILTFYGDNMEATFSLYKHVDSAGRINEILNSSDVNYQEKDFIPSRDQLTFTNGFYVNCCAMFVDMRGSKELSGKHKRPTLARIYRSYISELVAVMRDHTGVCEINIQGDGVWGVFNTPSTDEIDELFSVAAKVSSMIDILSWKLEQKSLEPITVGIGLSWGRALMVKAGHRGSSVSDVVWMGDVVNESAKLCEYGSSNYYDRETMVSSDFRNNLNTGNQSLLEWNSSRQCYHGNVINIEMDKWLKERKER